MRRLVANVLIIVGLAVVGFPAPAVAGVPHDRGVLDPMVPPRPAEASVWAPNGAIGHGRQQHAFRYRVTTAEEYWSLELFLSDPRGHQIASAYQNVGGDPMTGRDVFRFSSQSARPGKFTIRARLTWGDYDRAERWLKPHTFRMRR